MPPSHITIERINTHAKKPATVDSVKEIGLSIQIRVNRRSWSHVRIRTVSAMGKIRYTIIPQNDNASV